MIDLATFSSESQDFKVYNTDIYKAANILSVQLGALTYDPDFGIDLEYFLDPSFIYQNESFKNYLVQVLANSNINVNSITEVINTLYSKLTINIEKSDNDTSLVSR